MQKKLCKTCQNVETKHRSGECKECRNPFNKLNTRPSLALCEAFYEWAEPLDLTLTTDNLKRFIKEMRDGKGKGRSEFVLPHGGMPDADTQQSGVLYRLPASEDSTTSDDVTSSLPRARCTVARTRIQRKKASVSNDQVASRSSGTHSQESLAEVERKVEQAAMSGWRVKTTNLTDIIRNDVMSKWKWLICKFSPMAIVVVSRDSVSMPGCSGMVMACRRENNGIVFCRVHFGGSCYAWIPQSNLSAKAE